MARLGDEGGVVEEAPVAPRVKHSGERACWRGGGGSLLEIEAMRSLMMLVVLMEQREHVRDK